MKKTRLIATVVLLSYAWTASFAQYAAGACHSVPNSKTCVDTTPCKDIGGKVACLAGVSLPGGAVSIPQSCWQYSYDFACSSTVINTCTAYESNKACEIVSSKCTDTIPENGQCSSYTNVYSCKTKEETKEQKLSCSSGVFNSDSMPDPANTNNTFQKAALAQEILRESATYGSNGTNIFAGVAETCRKGYFGIKNCCKSAPGATSNSVMINTQGKWLSTPQVPMSMTPCIRAGSTPQALYQTSQKAQQHRSQILRTPSPHQPTLLPEAHH
jgi:conjugal transfer mating pair stabilization protein TraN